ncbi:MAG: Sjogren's syndrome/scleroderma autoantigen 1 family protein [Candidatus Sigynarchaeota archaeon]
MDKQDANIKKMAKALREGARMLDLACPVCNNPIFQAKNGEKMCVVCERKVIVEGEELKKKEENDPSLANEKISKKGASSQYAPVQAEKTLEFSRSIVSSLVERCMEKLTSLVGKLERLSDEHELSIVYDNILKVIEILKQFNYL